MGWNRLRSTAASALLEGVDSEAFAYFIHSYAVAIGPATRAVTDYGVPFSSVVEQRNFFGTQFHPERSAKTGAKILSNFIKM
jgi:glutamine amidotransferase